MVASSYGRLMLLWWTWSVYAWWNAPDFKHFAILRVNIDRWWTNTSGRVTNNCDNIVTVKDIQVFVDMNYESWRSPDLLEESIVFHCVLLFSLRFVLFLFCIFYTFSFLNWVFSTARNMLGNNNRIKTDWNRLGSFRLSVIFPVFTGCKSVIFTNSIRVQSVEFKRVFLF